jgi:1-deoxy-D-xylulose-5-phosphate synthase
LAAAENDNISVVDMRFIKPIDEALLLELCSTHSTFITLEDNAIMGGAGSAVSEFFAQKNVIKTVKYLGIPDGYIEHGSQSQQWAQMGLDAAGIKKALENL